MSPKVSIVIPAFNYGCYIRDAIESVLSQSYCDYELIILNNASEDDTHDVVQEYVSDSRVRYICNEMNIGANANFNKGIDLARGQYIKFLSADDYYLPNVLSLLVAELESYPSADFAYGRYVFVDADGRFTELVAHPGWEHFNHHEHPDEVGRLLAFDCYVSFPVTLFRKDIFDRYGVFDKELVVGDYDYFLRLASSGVKSRFIDIPLAAFRVHGDQASISRDFITSGTQYESQVVLLERFLTEDNVKQIVGHEQSIIDLLNCKILRYKASGGELSKEQRLRVQKVKQKLIALTSPEKHELLPENPLVSVIIPTLNRPKLLLKALASLKMQSYQNWEAIVINDGGLGMAPLVKNIDSRIYYVEHRNCMGQSTARNSGLKFAKGDVVCFLDDDDVFLENHLQTVVKKIKHSSFVYTLAEYCSWDESGNLIGKEVGFQGVEYSREKLLVENFIPINTWGVRKSKLQKVGFFDETMTCLEDWELLIRLSEVCDFEHIPKVTVNVNVKQGDRGGVSVSNRHKFHEVFKWIYQKHGKVTSESVLNGRKQMLLSLSGSKESVKNTEDIVNAREKLYKEWVGEKGFTVDDERILIKRLMNDEERNSSFNLLMIVVPGEERYLADTIDSLSIQLYQGWKLTVISGLVCPDRVFDDLESLEWIVVDQSENAFDVINRCIEKNGFDWVSLIEPGARLEIHCLGLLAIYIKNNPEWSFVYLDEDCLDELGERVEPKFKPDFDVDLLRSMPYLGSFCFVKVDDLLRLGGFLGLYGAENYDCSLRFYEQLGESVFGHISEIMIHRPYKPVREFDPEIGLQALSRHMEREGSGALVLKSEVEGCFYVKYKVDVSPKVSIIIATKDQLVFLKACVESIVNTTKYPNYEIIIIDNQSQELETKQYLEEIKNTHVVEIKVYQYSKPFNFSAINNFAVEQATGDYLVLLNNDTMVLQEEWLQGMLSHAQRKEVGIVGVKLVFPSKHVQHAGIVLGVGSYGVAAHPHIGYPMGAPGYMKRAVVVQGFSAVTAACLMISKEIYQQVGGLDEDKFKVYYNDVDLCLKVKELGYKVIWTPYVSLIHHGGRSLNKVKSDNKKNEEIRRQVDNMLEKWLPQLANDPAYNRNLSLKATDFKIDKEINVAWNVDFKGKPRIYAFPTDSQGVGQYRVRAPIKAITQAGLVESSLANNLDQLVFPSPVEIERIKPDVLLVQNGFLDHMLAAWKRYRRFNDVFMVCGQDDVVYMLPDQHPRKGEWPSNIRRKVKEQFQLSDRVIVANDALAEEFKKMAGDIVVVPNYLENSRWDSLVLPSQSIGKKLRVGWAGGQEHLGDLQFIVPVVKALYKEVDWVFMGLCIDELKSYVKEIHSGVPFELYPQKLAELNLDLAIAPLMHNKFNECKTNLRLLEYGILGWPVVCSDVLPYQNAPVTRVANNTQHWIKTIREKVNEPEALVIEGRALKKWVVDNYMLDDHVDEWFAALMP